MGSFGRQFDSTITYYQSNRQNIFELTYRDLIGAMKATNDSTITFELKRNHALFLNLVASPYCAPIMSSAALARFRIGEEFIPVGSGPFSWHGRDRDGNISLRRFDAYHGAKSHLEQLVFRVGGMEQLEDLALKDSVNVLWRIRGNMVERFRTSGKFALHSILPLSTFYVGFNLTSSQISEPATRKMIRACIDKQEFLSTSHRTIAVLAEGPVPPGLWFDEESVVAAARHVAAPDWWSAADELRLRIIGYSLAPRTTFYYNAIVKYLLQRGMSIEEDYFSSWDEFFEARAKGRYDMFFGTLRSDIVGDPYFFLNDLFHSSSSQNVFRYANAKVDSLLDDARTIQAREARYSVYREILTQIDQDAPAIFVLHPKEVFVVDDKLAPIVIDPYGFIHYETIQTVN